MDGVQTSLHRSSLPEIHEPCVRGSTRIQNRIYGGGVSSEGINRVHFTVEEEYSMEKRSIHGQRNVVNSSNRITYINKSCILDTPTRKKGVVDLVETGTVHELFVTFPITYLLFLG